MDRMLTRARRAAYAAAVLAAMSFGARAAVAAPLVMVCADPTAVGTCNSTSDCRKICNRLSNGLIPVCDTQSQCCTCQKL